MAKDILYKIGRTRASPTPICSMALVYLPTFARTKSPSHVGKYTSTMEHMGHVSSNSFGD